MSEHTLAWARKLMSDSGASVEVHFDEGGQERFKSWLGPDLPYRLQSAGDLGVRMHQAFLQAFQDGMKKVVIVGTDCPELSDLLVREAFQRLDNNEVVLGPAKDGGYYLIGLKRLVEEIFREIPWGTGKVLEKTLRIAGNLRIPVSLLEPLDDVDRPEDLPVWENFSSTPSLLEREGKGGGGALPISIIIPTLNEEKSIQACLASCGNSADTETIVVDGGSRDRTLEIARSCGAKIIMTPSGRGHQMNRGAQEATGAVLIFLHADTHLPEGFEDCVRQVLSEPGVVAGAFRFCLDASSPSLAIIQRVANWRSRRLQLPYGDQAIFIKTEPFREIGGFPDLPIMEDFEFIRRLKKKGRIHSASLPAITSTRRWTTIGVWKTTLINQMIVIAYYLGVSPFTLARWYRRKK